MLIGLSGKMGTGKTEFAHVAESCFGFKRLAFGDGVKEEVSNYLCDNSISFNKKNFYGNSTQKALPIQIPHHKLLTCMNREFFDLTSAYSPTHVTISYRNLLQWWGTEYRRKDNKSYWVERLFDKADTSIPTIIDDVRFKNEAEMIRVCGGLLVRINWPGAANSSEHKSETALDSYPFFNLTITKPEDATLEFCISEYHDILASILGEPHEKITTG